MSELDLSDGSTIDYGVTLNTTGDTIKGYKVLNSDFNGFEVGKTFTFKKPKDFSEFTLINPTDVFEFYSILDKYGLPTRFAKVSTDAVDAAVDTRGVENYGTCITSKLYIEEEISLEQLIQEQIDIEFETQSKSSKGYSRSHLLMQGTYNDDYLDKIKSNQGEGFSTVVCANFSCSHQVQIRNVVVFISSGYMVEFASDISRPGCTILSIGEKASLTSLGSDDKVFSCGGEANITSVGMRAELLVTGKKSRISSSGAGAKLYSTGDNIKISSTGDYATFTVTGKNSRITSSGDNFSVNCIGKDGVIALLGVGAKFEGIEGTLISAVVYGKRKKPIDVIKGRIGEGGLKPFTPYTVLDGSFVEVNTKRRLKNG